jgi:hypothetical protein
LNLKVTQLGKELLHECERRNIGRLLGRLRDVVTRRPQFRRPACFSAEKRPLLSFQASRTFPDFVTEAFGRNRFVWLKCHHSHVVAAPETTHVTPTTNNFLPAQYYP